MTQRPKIPDRKSLMRKASNQNVVMATHDPRYARRGDPVCTSLIRTSVQNLQRPSNRPRNMGAKNKKTPLRTKAGPMRQINPAPRSTQLAVGRCSPRRAPKIFSDDRVATGPNRRMQVLLDQHVQPLCYGHEHLPQENGGGPIPSGR